MVWVLGLVNVGLAGGDRRYLYRCEALIDPLCHTWQGGCNLMSVVIVMVLGLKVALFARYSVCYMGLIWGPPLRK